jgi:organic radical activating enzyme
MKAALVERFYSVQGEGANAGRPALFIRFAGCNLDCVFADGAICDTPWRKATEKVKVHDLLTWVDQVWKYSGGTSWSIAPIVILTGGEPTMSPAFSLLVPKLKQAGYYVAVESNGTIWREVLRLVDWLVVSPKDEVDHAAPLDQPDLHPDVEALPPHEYRYVIAGDSPTPPYRSGSVHYLSPAVLSNGDGALGFEGFADGAVDRCMEIQRKDPRWRLSLQTHKFMALR